MAQPQVNGEVHASAFVQHLLRYPVVHDSVDSFKNNPYGQRSIQLGDSAFNTFARPVLPYFARPYSYVQPYVKKADDLGDKTLGRVEDRFPAVRKPTDQLYADVKGLALLPYHKAFEGRDHVYSTYQAECKKAGDDASIVTYGKALVSTTLIVVNEAVAMVGGILAAKKEEVKDKVNNEKANN